MFFSILRWQRIFLPFSPNCFLWHNVLQVQSMPSTSKYSKTAKDHFLKNFQLYEIKNWRKAVIPPLMNEVFPYHRLSNTQQKSFPTNCFCNISQNSFDEKLWYLRYTSLYVSINFYFPTNRQRQKSSAKPEIFRNANWATY